jgi:hypothetical protein
MKKGFKRKNNLLTGIFAMAGHPQRQQQPVFDFLDLTHSLGHAGDC